MIITVASYKGGVGKTTTAVHLAACLQSKALTILVDGDPNRSAIGWAKRGSLPFRVIDERQAARYTREAEHIVIDTEARPNREDLEALVGGCDLLVIPCTPDALAIDALMLILGQLRQIENAQYRVLLTMIPPHPSRDGNDVRRQLSKTGIPVFQESIARRVAFQKAALNGCLVGDIKNHRGEMESYIRTSKEMVS